MEKKQRRANQVSKGLHLVSIIDYNGLSEMTDFLEEKLSKVMAIETLKGRPYSCLALRLLKGKEATRLESKEQYLFDISKANQIFDHLLRDH